MKYHVSQPQITPEDVEAVNKVMEKGMVSSVGEEVQRFAQEFAEYNGCKYGVTCNSGMNAIYLALRACGVGPGDEVIIPEFTMIATAYAVSYTGATPVFVDCGEDLNMHPLEVMGKISSRTKAIVPVHIYGRQCDMRGIMELASLYNLKVIEDSAEAHGIKPRGDVACFSLFANKIITSGEGGVLVTDDKNIADEAYHLANMAFDPEHTFLHTKIAHNHRMTNLQGALALSQLSRIDEILEKRKQIESWYNEYLPSKVLMPDRDVLWMYDVTVKDSEKVREHLEKKGIETRVFFKPMTMQKPYFDPSFLQTKAYHFSRIGFYLPTYTDLTEADVQYISSCVKEVL